MTVKASPATVRALIAGHEGRTNRPYLCSAGKLTIGIGRNLDDVGLTNDEVDYLFENDIRRATRWCGEVVPHFAILDSVRQMAFLDLMFNLGPTRLRGFRKALAAVERMDWETAADELIDSRWYTQVGRRGPRIVHMVRTGEMP
jgi:lysozyme